MYSVKSIRTSEAVIKKSRFIGVIAPCADETEIRDALHTLQREHPNATHIAFAFRLKTAAGIISRFYDAGEPGGTAGKPIYQHIEGKNLINVLVAVVRYFGGIKLGAGVLARAYGNAARRVIEESDVNPHVELERMVLEIGYDRLQTLEYALTKLDGRILSQVFGERVKVVVSLPEDYVSRLREQFGDAERRAD